MQASDANVQAYFKKLIDGKLHGPPIACEDAGKDKGKGVFARSTFAAGSPIWTEAPFVAMQHEDNREFVDCCDECFVPLIDTSDCWQRVQSTSTSESVATEQDFYNAIDYLQKEGGKTPEESYFSVFTLGKGRVDCPHKCHAQYCSQTCLDKAFKEHHALLCTRSEDNSSAMGHFINHSMITNEIFQLAAKVLSRILSSFIQTQDLSRAKEPVDMFCKQPWWEVITSEADLEADDSETLEEYQAKFKDLLAQTFGHLRAGLEESLSTLEKNEELNGLTTADVLSACAPVLNVDFFSQIVGMFEMNNISMEIDHPFHALAEALAEAANTEKKSAGMPPVLVRVKNALRDFSASHHHVAEEVEPDEEDASADDEDFVGVEGTALFSGICTMNHSCDPNCTVLYTKDGSAHVFAVQPIKEGDELCISYIDVDQNVHERHECLREYQFTCTCPRCQEELCA